MFEAGKITHSESTALSVIRIFAMTMIVLCHVSQCYGFRISYLLNVGVQIFFFMSGFLYGRLGVSSPLTFYKKRFVKVLLPYYILLAIIVVIYTAFHLYQIDAKQIVLYALSLQWFSTPIDGLNHLWFLTVLTIAYLLTPWVIRFYKKSQVACILIFMALGVLEFLFVRKFYSFFAWLALFMAGLLFGMNYTKRVSNYVLVISSVALAILAVFFSPSWLTQQEFRYHTIWLHWILGVFLFVLLFQTLSHVLCNHKKWSFIKHVDSISYEVYLIHHPLILGPLSMMFLTKYVWLNLLLLLVAVYLLARLFHYLNSFSKFLI